MPEESAALARSYNDRLFSGGIRKRLHEGRFLWLHRESRNLSGSVIELGCFDCRSLDHLAFTPTRYLGIDANWEGGLDLARKRRPDLDLVQSTEPAAISGTFDCAVALETLEHLPRERLDEFIAVLARAAPTALITVPVEIGPVFAVKQLVRPDNSYHYTLKEYVLASLGLTKRIAQSDHKGFNFLWLRKKLEVCYEIERMTGIPKGLPPLLSFNVGFRCRSRLF